MSRAGVDACRAPGLLSGEGEAYWATSVRLYRTEVTQYAAEPDRLACYRADGGPGDIRAGRRAR